MLNKEISTIKSNLRTKYKGLEVGFYNLKRQPNTALSYLKTI